MVLSWIRTALVDLRGDLRHFGLLVACLALGTCQVAAIGSIGEALTQAVQRDSRVLAGGDLEATPIGRMATPDEEASIGAFGEVVRILDSTAMVTAGPRSGLADLLAVSANYPAAGELISPQLPAGTRPQALLTARNGTYGAIVDPRLLDQLGLALGGSFVLAGTSFEVRGVLVALPDGATRGFQLGYPLIISLEAYQGLSAIRPPVPGLLTHDRHKLLLGSGSGVSVAEAIRQALPGWRVRMPQEVIGDLARYYQLFAKFTLLVSLSALLIGGVGIWNGVSAYLQGRWRSIAVLRSLGATTSRLFVHFLSQVAVLAILGIGLGVALGALAAALVLPGIGRMLSADLPPALHVGPLLVASAFAGLVSFAFSYLPLAKASTIRPALLFRSIAAEDAATPRLGWIAGLPALAALLLAGGIAAAVTGDPLLILLFSAGAAFVALLLRAAGSALLWTLRRAEGLSPLSARWAVRSICAPATSSRITVLSMGLGLAVLLAVALLGSNLGAQLLQGVREDAPTFILSGLLDDEVATLRGMLASDPDFASLATTPMVPADVVSVRGIDPKSIPNLPEEAEFMLSGSIPVTFATTIPARSTVVDGAWWPADYSGPPLVSLRETMRLQLGLKLGDTIVLDVMGDRIEARISSFRAFDWQGGSNLMVTLTPSALADYPFTTMAAVRARAGGEQALETALVAAFPGVSIVPVGDALEQADGILEGLRAAIETIVAAVVANGALALASALARGRQQREADSIVFKVLGATRASIIAAFVLEFTLLGLFAAAMASLLGIGAAWAITRSALEVPFAVDTGLLAGIVAGAMLVVLAMGMGTMWSALSGRPAQYLRDG